MKNGMNTIKRKTKLFLIPGVVLTIALSGILGLGGRIWADRTNMTRVRFNNALFCQRVSQAINDSLGNGTSDGSDCANFNLYVTTNEIGNIRSLDIVPPDNGFGNIDLESQPIGIGGEWVSKFNNLTSLSITNMHVQDITPLEGLTSSLTYLNLSNNNIYDVTPVKELKNSLTSLNLSGNPISAGVREISRFTRLTVLSLANTDYTSIDELFQPPMVEPRFDDLGNFIGAYDAETGERLSEVGYDQQTGELIGEPISSKLAKVLHTFDISSNESLSDEKADEDYVNACDGSIRAFEDYKRDLVISELYASGDGLNKDDLHCISKLNNLTKLDVSNNHIADFQPIKNKTYAMLKADSQVFVRSIESLDYSPLPEIFTHVQQENYFSNMDNATNTAVPLSSLGLDNAQFYGNKVRFVNAAAASNDNEQPRPATVSVPANSGVFANSKLQVYFAGQVVTFNDSNLCNEVYAQGISGTAFIDADGVYTGSDEPVVLTNACNDANKKQIALISGGSYLFLRLSLDSVNDGAVVDLTGLEEFGSLQVLSLNNNNLRDISKLANLTSLQQLWLNDNRLDSENWSTITDNLTQLSILYLNNNNMNTISSSISNLSELGNLYLVNNGISDVSPLAQATTLTVLDLSENSRINDLSGLVQGEFACTPSVLKMENTGLTSLPNSSIIERAFAHLTSLNLNGNQITDISIPNLTSAHNLDELYLNSNRISDTSGFRGITSLKKLFLDNNQITNISGLTYLTRLSELHLNGNRINDITGINSLPALATLDLKNQTLNGTISEDDEPYNLPAIFSQAKSMSFPRVSDFQSTSDYVVTNGTVDYSRMTATITNTSESMTVTIPDGGLAGTVVTVVYNGSGAQNLNVTDHTGGIATISSSAPNKFTITSNKACMALWSNNGGTTWSRLSSTAVPGHSNMREFDVSQTNGAEVVVYLAGDVNNSHTVDVRDVRKITNSIMGSVTLSSQEKILAEVDGRTGINVRDVRAITNYIIGKTDINW